MPVICRRVIKVVADFGNMSLLLGLVQRVVRFINSDPSGDCVDIRAPLTEILHEPAAPGN